MNQIILVGRITEINDNGVTIGVTRAYKNANGEYETDFIPIRLFNNILTTTKEYTRLGDIIGVKGRLETHNTQLIVVADKVTFLSSSNPTKDNPNPQPNQTNLNEGEI